MVSVAFSAEKVHTDKIDEQLLQLISKYGKTTILKLSKLLAIDIKTVKSRIKRLEHEGVILGYKADIDVSKLDRDFYTVEINLNDYKKYIQLKEELLSLRELTSWVVSIGSYDLEFDMEIDTTKRFYEIVETLKSKYSEIREIRYFRVIKNYKIHYYPEN